MQQEFTGLKDEVESLEKELNRLKDDWQADRAEREAHLQKTIQDYESRLKEQKADTDHLKTLFLKEIMIKDQIIEQETGLKEKYCKLAKQLDMTLRVPRHHAEFLKAKGALDHFVSAKLTGDNISAKWLLRKAGKPEINEIAKTNQDNARLTANEARRIQKLKMYGLLDRAKSQESKDGFG